MCACVSDVESAPVGPLPIAVELHSSSRRQQALPISRSGHGPPQSNLAAALHLQVPRPRRPGGHEALPHWAGSGARQLLFALWRLTLVPRSGTPFEERRSTALTPPPHEMRDVLRGYGCKRGGLRANILGCAGACYTSACKLHHPGTSSAAGAGADAPFFFLATGASAAGVDDDFFLAGAVAGAKVGLVE